MNRSECLWWWGEEGEGSVRFKVDDDDGDDVTDDDGDAD